MTTPRSRIWFYEFRPTGPRAGESAELHSQVLDLWATGRSKTEIARLLEIDKHTVRRITWKARKTGDPRGFARTKPIAVESQVPVEKIYKEQYIIRGLARALEVPHAVVEAAVRSVVKQLREQE